jgi:hypothetical protein
MQERFYPKDCDCQPVMLVFNRALLGIAYDKVNRRRFCQMMLPIQSVGSVVAVAQMLVLEVRVNNGHLVWTTCAGLF